MSEYKTIYRPKNGWCSELHEPTPANSVIETVGVVCLAVIIGTAMLPFYVVKSYIKAFERVKYEN